MKTLIAIALIFWSVRAFSSGTFLLEGKVISWSQKTVSVSDGAYIYELDKSKLSVQEKGLADLKYGQRVSLAVPFDSVKNVKQAKKM